MTQLPPTDLRKGIVFVFPALKYPDDTTSLQEHRLLRIYKISGF